MPELLKSRRGRASSELPRILIDARMVTETPHGIARYVKHLAQGLARLRQKYPPAYEPVFFVNADYSRPDFFGNRAIRMPVPFLARAELRELPAAIRAAGASLYHSPSFSSLLTQGPWRAHCPWILTVHDLNHLTFGNWKQRLYYRSILRPFARKAAALATVSVFSREEIARWLPIEPARIEVVYNALDPALRVRPGTLETQATLARFGLEAGKYFLCISNAKPHKNIDLLVEAYFAYRRAVAHAADPSAQPWNLVLSLKEFGDRPGVKAVGPLADREAQVLRTQAGAVAFPSVYEGFGLPPIEGALAGAPLIVSRIPPHQEGLVDLGPDEVTWADPRDRDAWQEGLLAAWRGGLPRPSDESRERILSRFSEDNLARHMDRIYRRVLMASN